jgi:sterol desaturase/sphingolipid hydroxylase (fatty acid hydroxylase superfamily)
MLGHESDSHDPLAARQRSRRIIWALVAVGSLAFVGGLELGRPLLGVGLYWACGVGFMTYAAITDSDPYDERDLEIQAKAAGSTLTVAAVALIAGAPGMAALEAANAYSAPGWFWGAIFALAGVFAVFAIAMTYHKRLHY